MQVFNKKLFLTLLIVLAGFLLFAQENETMNFKGKREPLETGDFILSEINSSRVDSSTLRLDLLFNQMIDPDSVNGAVFVVNGKALKPNSRIEYSKDAKKCRIELSVKEKSFDFEVSGIKSYNGKLLKKTKIKINDNGSFKVLPQ